MSSDELDLEATRRWILNTLWMDEPREEYRYAIEGLGQLSNNNVCTIEVLNQWLQKYEFLYRPNAVPFPGINRNESNIPNYVQFHSFYRTILNIVDYHGYKEMCIQAMAELNTIAFEHWNELYYRAFIHLLSVIFDHWGYYQDDGLEDILFINHICNIHPVRLKLDYSDFEEIILFAFYYLEHGRFDTSC